MNRIACVGEALIDFVAQTQLADVGASEYFLRAAGGAVSNVAVGIARLGGRSTFAGAIARDPFGTFLLRTLARENVDVDATRLVDASTTLAFVARGPAGARDFFFVRNPGADSLLQPDDLDAAMLKNARVVHFGGVLMSSEPGRSASLRAAEIGRSAGALVSFDPNARGALFASADEMRDELRSACRRAALVKCSIDDLSTMGVDPDDPKPLFADGVEALVVTDGDGECRWFASDGALGKALPPQVEPIDTTGAGDAFMAALLVRMVEHHDARPTSQALDDCVRYACAAGALATLQEGAIPSMPHAADVETLLAKARA